MNPYGGLDTIILILSPSVEQEKGISFEGIHRAAKEGFSSFRGEKVKAQGW